MKIFFMCALLLYAFPAMAKQYHAGPCGPVTRYKLGDDVEYKAGVDVHGRAVPPADTAPSALTAEDFNGVAVDIGLPLNAYTSTPPFNTGSSQSGIAVGTLSLEGNEATFNGKSLKNEDTDRYIQEGCPPER